MNDSENNKKTLAQKISALVKFLTFGIWSLDTSEMSKTKAGFLGFLRIITTTIFGIVKNKIPLQASSLSYTTLLALGPIVAVVMIFSGMVFREKGDEFISQKIVEAVVFVMPAVTHVVDNNATQQNGQTTNIAQVASDKTIVAEAPQEINPDILKFINKISQRSASLGIVGSLTVVFTCLLLCVNMESAFNTIWGVSKGRNWMMRFSFYWMLITLGVVLGISGMTFLTGSQLGGMFKDIPFISEYANWGVQLAGMGALTVALALFYKFMPNTRVKVVPAIIGAAIVTCLLLGNNKLSFLYIGKVVQQQSFYGYLAIVPVAMFSLYIFWLFILMGAQITYSIQNVDFLTSNQMWKRTGAKAKELICLAIYSEISKAFYEDKEAPSLKKLCDILDMPKEIATACLNTLEEKDMICAVESEEGDTSFKPSHSPDKIKLSFFFEKLSKNDGDELLELDISKRNITASHALNAFKEFSEGEYAQKTIKDLLY